MQCVKGGSLPTLNRTLCWNAPNFSDKEKLARKKKKPAVNQEEHIFDSEQK